MHTWFSSCLEVLAEVWDTRDQSSSTTIDFTSVLSSTTQTCSGGIFVAYYLATHQFQMRTESGVLDKLQCSISTIVLYTDTEWESQDTFLGMDRCRSQWCHTLWIREQMSSTVPSRETLTLRLRSSEFVICQAQTITIRLSLSSLGKQVARNGLIYLNSYLFKQDLQVCFT